MLVEELLGQLDLLQVCVQLSLSPGGISKIGIMIDLTTRGLNLAWIISAGLKYYCKHKLDTYLWSEIRDIGTGEITLICQA